MKLRAVSGIMRAHIVVLLILLALTIYVPIPVVSQVPPIVPCPSETFEKYGPRVSNLVFTVWGDVIAEANALATGDIDVMDWATPGSDVAAWMADPNITLGDYSEWGWYEYDINNAQWPTGHGEMTPPGWTGSEPAVTTGHYWQNYTEDGADFCQRCYDARQFRRALAHLANRTAMVANMGGFAEPLETFIFPDIAEWENPAAPKYAYSLALAEAALSAGGFEDWDSDGTIEYSPGHDGVIVEDLPTLMGWIRDDDPDRTFAGIQLRGDLLDFGVPLDMPVADRSTCYYHAWVVYDYHVHTGGWSWGRVPDMYCELWHSSKDTYPSAGADNYNRYHNQQYDELAWGLKTAPTAAAAESFIDQCQMMIHRDAACIPLYTHEGYTAHRTKYQVTPPLEEAPFAGLKWEGFINELGSGFYSGWSALNVHPEGFEKGGWDDPHHTCMLRHGLLHHVEKWSPVQAEWFCDWLVLQQIYEPLIAYHPLNATKFVGMLAQDVPDELTWEFDGENCTRLRFELVPNILWHDKTPLTPEDVGFSFTYMRDEGSVANFWAVQNYEGYATSDNATVPWGDVPPPGFVDILYNVQSWLAPDWAAGVPIIPKHIWEGQDSWTYNPEDEGTVIGTGPFMAIGGEGPHEGEVGWPDWTLEYVHLNATPFYFKRYIWPDICEDTHTPGVTDGWVDLDDFMELTKPGHEFTYDPRLYPVYPPWDPVWGPIWDVNKDGAIDTFDILDMELHLPDRWPPPWYVDCPHSCIDVKTASAGSLPVIYVDREISHCPVDSNFTININIANVTVQNSQYGVYGWQFFMSFNSSLIEVVDINVGPWLSNGGPTGVFYRIANKEGTLIYGSNAWNGTVGSGTLANVTFNVVAEGKCPLHLYMNKLRTFNGTDILVVDHMAVDGIFTIAGDANGDGDVDASDLSDFSKAYGSDQTKPNWNPKCDFNIDNQVDASDLFDLSKNYGKTV